MSPENERNTLIQSNTQSSSENRDEMDRILAMLADHADEMTAKDRVILEWDDGREITPRMLFWARDAKERYCL